MEDDESCLDTSLLRKILCVEKIKVGEKKRYL